MFSTWWAMAGILGPAHIGWCCMQDAFPQTYTEHHLQESFLQLEDFIKRNHSNHPKSVAIQVDSFFFPPVKFCISFQLFYSLWEGLYEWQIHHMVYPCDNAQGTSTSSSRCEEHESTLLQFLPWNCSERFHADVCRLAWSQRHVFAWDSPLHRTPTANGSTPSTKQGTTFSKWLAMLGREWRKYHACSE